MNDKYKLTTNTKEVYGRVLYRIKALKDFGDIVKGELGGWVEAEKNLQVSGNAWVYGNAQVSGNAGVFGNARVYGNAQVYGDARVSGNAQVYGDAQVFGNAWVSGDAGVYGDALVYGNALVSGNAGVYGDARVYGNARVYSDALFWISKIGSENGTLTAFLDKDQNLCVTRGCFCGTLKEFKKAVKEKHENTALGLEYKAAIKLIELRAKRFEVANGQVQGRVR